LEAEGASGTTIRHIGRYKVEAELGRGGMGRVYRAWDPDMRRPVAIKVLLVPSDPESLKRFRLEAHTTASLHHKNIVTIHASGEESGAPYLVMEFLEGQTLGEAIKKQVPLGLVEKVDVMTQVAEGLAYAHSKGVIHRDVKPGNIMLLADGGVKIMDFGVALAASRVTFSGTAHGSLIGTVPYMSPEQLGTGSKADRQSDIFAYGNVYYELLTGKHPFLKFEHDFVALQMAILTQEPELVSRLAPECPSALELLIHRALAKDRELRYREFDEVRLDSQAILVELQHDRAERILAAVPEIVQGGDLQKAFTMVRQALQWEPGNKRGRQILQTIVRHMQQTQNLGRIPSLEAAASRYIVERQFAKAIKTLEIALELDSSNQSVRERLAEARTKLDCAVRASRLVAEARLNQQKELLSEALEKLQAALEIDPDHADAKELLPRVREEFERQPPAGLPNLAPTNTGGPMPSGLDQATGMFAPIANVASEAPSAPLLPWTSGALACFEQRVTHEIAAPQLERNERPHEEVSVPLAAEPCLDAAANQDRWFHSVEREIREHQQKDDWPAAMQIAESALSLAPGDARVLDLLRNLRRDRLRLRLGFLYACFGPMRIWGRGYRPSNGNSQATVGEAVVTNSAEGFAADRLLQAGNAGPIPRAIWFVWGVVFMAVVLKCAWIIVDATIMRHTWALHALIDIGLAMLAIAGVGVALGLAFLGSMQLVVLFSKLCRSSARHLEFGADTLRFFISGAAFVCLMAFLPAAAKDLGDTLALTIFIVPVVILCLVYLALIGGSLWLLLDYRLHRAAQTGQLDPGRQ